MLTYSHNQCDDMIRALFGRWLTVEIVSTHLSIRNVHERLKRIEARGYKVDRKDHPDGKRKVYRIAGLKGAQNAA